MLQSECVSFVLAVAGCSVDVVYAVRTILCSSKRQLDVFFPPAEKKRGKASIA